MAVGCIEVLYFEGCPGYEPAASALSEALSREGVDTEVRLVEVGEDGRLGFSGSPTILSDGWDLFPAGEAAGNDSAALHCRVYETSEGLRNHPTAAMIRTALKTRF